MESPMRGARAGERALCRRSFIVHALGRSDILVMQAVLYKTEGASGESATVCIQPLDLSLQPYGEASFAYLPVAPRKVEIVATEIFFFAHSRLEQHDRVDVYLAQPSARTGVHANVHAHVGGFCLPRGERIIGMHSALSMTQLPPDMLEWAKQHSSNSTASDWRPQEVPAAAALTDSDWWWATAGTATVPSQPHTQIWAEQAAISAVRGLALWTNHGVYELQPHGLSAHGAELAIRRVLLNPELRQEEFEEFAIQTVSALIFSVGFILTQDAGN